VAEFTLRLQGTDVKGVSVDGVPLERASSRAGFEDGMFLDEGTSTLVAFTPQGRSVVVEVV
jgi:hypothetical protein